MSRNRQTRTIRKEGSSIYGTIFDTMYSGSMVGAGPTVFALMPYAVTHCNDDGYVEINPRLVAGIFGTQVEDVVRALEYLCAADPDSRSESEEGRRLIHEGAFLYRIVNHQKYKDLRRAEDDRASLRERVRKHREARKHVTDSNGGVTPCNGHVTVCNAEVTAAQEFEQDFWPGVPRTCRKDKKKAKECYVKLRKTLSKEQILAGLPSYCAKEERRSRKPDYLAHSPFRWLRDRRWEDEDVVPRTPQEDALEEFRKKQETEI